MKKDPIIQKIEDLAANLTREIDSLRELNGILKKANEEKDQLINELTMQLCGNKCTCVEYLKPDTGG